MKKTNHKTKIISKLKAAIDSKLQYYFHNKSLLILPSAHDFFNPINLGKQYLTLFISKMKRSGKSFYNPLVQSEYLEWLKEQKESIDQLDFIYRPKISFIVPVFNVDPQYLKECIESVLEQSYSNVEICLVDDASTNSETIALLKNYQGQSERIKIKFRSENGHICEASNDALEMSTGDYIGLLDHDDILDRNACQEIVSVLNKDSTIDFIYTDEDKIDLSGKFRYPHFKPDFSRDALLSLNYISHLAVIKKTLIVDVGSFRQGYEGAQDYDLYLRIIEKTNKIYHIPKILYHWRMLEGSTASHSKNKSYALEASRKTLLEYLCRNEIKAEVLNSAMTPSYFQINYFLDSKLSTTVILDSIGNDIETLFDCLESIYSSIKNINFDVFAIVEESKYELIIAELRNLLIIFPTLQIVTLKNDDCLSQKINNIVQKTNSDFILFMNSKLRMIQEDFIRVMASYASQSHVGAVGPKILDKTLTVRSCGYILGLSGQGKPVFSKSSILDSGIYGRLSVVYDYSAIQNDCLLISRSKYDSVSGFCEDLSYGDSTLDLCLRLLEKGYFNLVIPFIMIVDIFPFDPANETVDLENECLRSKWCENIKRDPFYNQNLSLIREFKLDKNKRSSK